MVDALETKPFPVMRHSGDAVAEDSPRPEQGAAEQAETSTGTHSGANAGVPSITELITEAHNLARRDQLPFSGHIVIEKKGTAVHQHDVWLLGPFALVEGGWFGQVHGAEHQSGTPRWLRKHERKCRAVHWTGFQWIDESSLEEGCGTTGIGLGIGPEGPHYCAFTAGRSHEHVHVPLTRILRNGLRELALLRH